MAKTKKSKNPSTDVEIVKLTVKLDSMDEKLDNLGNVVLGNGTPDKGLLVTMVRMEQKMDAFLDHLENKLIHRTEGMAVKNMFKTVLWALPLGIAGVIGIVLTVTGQWPAFGTWLEKLLGLGG